MSTHFLTIHHESYDRSTVFGVFDTFLAARDHLEAEAEKPGAYSSAALAVVEEWDGPKLVATHERAILAPKVWEAS
ncbi:hypothetical protein J7E68_14970 [Microbacterium sp. ISL-103]|uniref:hypothetical protein n=1 Tax=Microbacterium sp. ISL-103 TaxID=2819156 RepID=UPI001BE805E0|nr:hypothetical protein [Microbacterium sp. ISL-103]MBT2475840.1 hypothetical protein [Microbacterium sp. ISL-103]